MIRNNLFAFGEQGIIKLAGDEPGVNTFTFQNNVVMTDGAPVFRANYYKKLENRTFESDLNLFWDIGQKPIIVENLVHGKKAGIRFSFDWWQNQNLQDRHSLIDDPGCFNWKNDDFSVRAGTPALEVGFVPIELKDAGPRKAVYDDQDSRRESEPEVRPFGHVE